MVWDNEFFRLHVVRVLSNLSYQNEDENKLGDYIGYELVKPEEKKPCTVQIEPEVVIAP